MPEGELRARYADFCAAHFAEIFLGLSDERLYEIVENELRMEETHPRKVAFREKVRLATRFLRRNVALPSFQEWCVLYHKPRSRDGEHE